MTSVASSLGRVRLDPKGGISFDNEVDLGKVLTLTKSDSLSLRRDALWLLWKISQDNQMKAKFRELDGLDPLLDCLEVENAEVRRLALRTLCNLSFDDKNTVEVRQLGGIGPVIDCLFPLDSSGEDVETTRAALRTLCNLSINDENKIEIRLQGGLQPIVECLLSDDVQTKRDALRTLCNLSINIENKMQLRPLHAIEYIVECLHAADLETRRYALASIINLSNDDENEEEIRKHGGLRHIVECLKVKDLPTRRFAMRALCNLSISSETKIEISQLGGIRDVLECLRDADVELKCYSLAAVMHLCGDETNNSRVSEFGYISKIAAFLQASEAEVKRYALGTISALAQNERNRRELLSAGSLAHVFAHLSSSDIKAKRYAFKCLQRLVVETDVAAKVKDVSYMKVIAEGSRSSDVEITKSACDILITMSNLPTVRSMSKGLLLPSPVSGVMIDNDRERADVGARLRDEAEADQRRKDAEAAERKKKEKELIMKRSEAEKESLKSVVSTRHRPIVEEKEKEEQTQLRISTLESEIRSLKDELQDKTDAFQRATTESTSSELKLSGLEKQLKSTQSELASMRTELNRSRQQLSDKDSEFDKLHAQLRDAQQKLKTVEAEKERVLSDANVAEQKLRDEVSRLDAQLEKSSKEYEKRMSEAMAEHARLTESITSLEGKLASQVPAPVASEVGEATEEVETMSTPQAPATADPESEPVSQAHDASSEREEEANRRIHLLEEELQIMMKSHDEAEATLRAEVKQLQQRVIDLSTEIGQTEKSVSAGIPVESSNDDELREQLIAMRKEVDVAKLSAQREKSRADALTAEIHILQSQPPTAAASSHDSSLTDLRGALSKLRTELIALSEDVEVGSLSQMQAEVEHATAKLAARERHLEELAEGHAAIVASSDKLKFQNDELKRELFGLKEELSAAKEKGSGTDALSRRITELEADKASLLRQMNEVASGGNVDETVSQTLQEVATLQKRAETVTGERDNALQSLEAAQAETNRLREDTSKLQEQRRVESEQYQQLVTEMEDLKEREAESSAEIMQLQSMNVQLRRAAGDESVIVKALEERLSSVESELELAKEALEAAGMPVGESVTSGALNADGDEVASLQAKINRLEAALRESAEESKGAEMRIQTLEQEVSALQSAASRASSALGVVDQVEEALKHPPSMTPDHDEPAPAGGSDEDVTHAYNLLQVRYGQLQDEHRAVLDREASAVEKVAELRLELSVIQTAASRPTSAVSRVSSASVAETTGAAHEEPVPVKDPSMNRAETDAISLSAEVSALQSKLSDAENLLSLATEREQGAMEKIAILEAELQALPRPPSTATPSLSLGKQLDDAPPSSSSSDKPPSPSSARAVYEQPANVEAHLASLRNQISLLETQLTVSQEHEAAATEKVRQLQMELEVTRSQSAELASEPLSAVTSEPQFGVSVGAVAPPASLASDADRNSGLPSRTQSGLVCERSSEDEELIFGLKSQVELLQTQLALSKEQEQAATEKVKQLQVELEVTRARSTEPPSGPPSVAPSETDGTAADVVSDVPAASSGPDEPEKAAGAAYGYHRVDESEELVSGLRRQVALLETQLALCKEQEASATDKVKQLQAELEVTRAQSTEPDTASKSATPIVDDVSTLERKHVEVVNGLNASIERLVAEKMTLQQQLGKATEDVNGLKANLIHAKQLLSESTETGAAANEKIEMLKRELEAVSPPPPVKPDVTAGIMSAPLHMPVSDDDGSQELEDRLRKKTMEAMDLAEELQLARSKLAKVEEELHSAKLDVSKAGDELHASESAASHRISILENELQLMKEADSGDHSPERREETAQVVDGEPAERPDGGDDRAVLDQQIASLHQTLASMKSTEQQLRNDREELQRQLAELQGEHESAMQREMEGVDRIAILEKELTILRASLNDDPEAKEQVSNDEGLRNASTDDAHTGDVSKPTDVEISQLQSVITDLRSELERARDDVSSSKSAEDVLRGKIEELEQSLHDYNEQINMLKKELDLQQARFDTGETDGQDTAERESSGSVVATSEAVNDEDLERAKAHINALNETIARLTSEVSTLKDEMGSLQSQNHELDGELKAVLERETQGVSRIAELQSELAAISRAPMDVQKSRDDEDFDSQKDDAMAEPEAVNAHELERLHNTIANLQAELDTSHKKNATLAESTQQERESHEAEHQEFEARESEYISKIHSLEDEIRLLGQKLDSVLSAPEGGDATQMPTEHIAAIRAEYSRSIEEKDSELDKTRGSLAAILSERDDLRQELEEKSSAFEEEVQNLKLIQNDYVEKISQLEREVEMLMAGADTSEHVPEVAFAEPQHSRETVDDHNVIAAEPQDDHATEMISQLQDRILVLSQALEKAQTDYQERGAEVDELKLQLDHGHEREQEAAQLIQQLKSELHTVMSAAAVHDSPQGDHVGQDEVPSNSECNSAIDELASLRSNLSLVQDQNIDLRATIAGFESQLHDLKTEKDTLEQSLMERIEALHDSETGANNRIRVLESELEAVMSIPTPDPRENEASNSVADSTSVSDSRLIELEQRMHAMQESAIQRADEYTLSIREKEQSLADLQKRVNELQSELEESQEREQEGVQRIRMLTSEMEMQPTTPEAPQSDVQIEALLVENANLKQEIFSLSEKSDVKQVQQTLQKGEDLQMTLRNVTECVQVMRSRVQSLEDRRSEAQLIRELTSSESGISDDEAHRCFELTDSMGRNLSVLLVHSKDVLHQLEILEQLIQGMLVRASQAKTCGVEASHSLSSLNTLSGRVLESIEDALRQLRSTLQSGTPLNVDDNMLSRVDELTSRYDSLRERISTFADSEPDHKHSPADGSDSDLSVAHERIMVLEKEVRLLHEQQEAQQEEIERYESDLHKARDQVTQLASKEVSDEASALVLQQQIEQANVLRNELDLMRRDMRTSIDAKHSAEEEADAAVQRVQELQTEIENQRIHFESNVETLSSEVEAYRRILAEKAEGNNNSDNHEDAAVAALKKRDTLIKDLEATVDSLRKESSSLTAEKEVLSEQLTAALEKVRMLESEVRHQAEYADKERNMHTNELRSLRDTVRDLTSQVLDKEQQNADHSIGKQQMSLQSEMNSVNDFLSYLTLQAQYQELRQAAEEKVGQVRDELERTIMSTTAELESLQGTVAEKDTRIRELEVQIEAVREKLSGDSVANAEMIKILSTANTMSKQELEEIQSAAENKVHELQEELSVAIESHSNEKAELEIRLHEATQERDDLRRKVTELEIRQNFDANESAALSALQEELHRLQVENRGASEKIFELQTELNRQSTHYEQLCEEGAIATVASKKALDARASEVHAVEAELEAAKELLQKREKDIRELEEAKTAAEFDKGARESDLIRDADIKIKDLQKELEHTLALLQTSDSEKIAAESELKMIKEKFSSQLGEIAELNDTLKMNAGQLESASDADKLRVQLHAAEERIAMLEQEVKQMEKFADMEKGDIVSANAKLSKEVEVLQDQIKAVEHAKMGASEHVERGTEQRRLEEVQRDLDAAHVKISELSEELKSQEEWSKKSLSELEVQRTTAEGDLRATKDECAMLQRRIKELQSASSFASNDLEKKHQASTDDAKLAFDRVQVLENELAQQTDFYENEVRTLRRRVTELEDKSRVGTPMIRSNSAVSERKDSTEAELMDKIHELEKSVDEYDVQMRAAAERIKVLESELAMQREFGDKRERDLKRQVDSLEQQRAVWTGEGAGDLDVQSLRQRLETLTLQHQKELEDRTEQLRMELLERERMFETERDSLSAAEQKIQVLEMELQQQNQYQSTEINDIQQVNIRLRGELSDAQKAVSLLERQRTQLKVELENAQSTLEDGASNVPIDEQVRFAKQKIDMLEDELVKQTDFHKVEIASVQNEMEKKFQVEMDAVRERHSDEVERLEEEIRDLKEQLARLKSSYNTQLKQLNSQLAVSTVEHLRDTDVKSKPDYRLEVETPSLREDIGGARIDAVHPSAHDDVSDVVSVGGDTESQRGVTPALGGRSGIGERFLGTVSATMIPSICKRLRQCGSMSFPLEQRSVAMQDFHSLTEMCSKSRANRTEVRKEEIMEIAAMALFHSENDISLNRHAILLLAVLTTDSGSEVELRNVDCIDSVAQCLEQRDVSIKRAALLVMRAMAADEILEPAVLQSSSALETIVAIAGGHVATSKEDDDELVRQALRTLRAFAFSTLGKSQIRLLGGIAVLLRTLQQSTDMDQKRNAIRTLMLLSITPENRVEIRQQRGLKVLVDALNSHEDEEIRRSAAGCLINLSVNSRNKKELVSCGALQGLISCIRKSSDVDLKRYSVRTISNLSLSEEGRAELVNLGGLEPLVACIDSNDVGTRRFALRSISYVVSNMSDTQASLKKAGIVSRLLPFISCADKESAKDSVLLLSILGQTEDVREQLRKAGTVSTCISLLSKSYEFHDIDLDLPRDANARKAAVQADPELRDKVNNNELFTNVLALLWQLSFHAECCNEMLRTDIFRYILGSLRHGSSNSRQCRYAVGLVSNLAAHDSAKRTLAQIVDMVGSITSCLQSADEDIVLDAMHVVFHLSTIPEMRAGLRTQGGLASIVESLHSSQAQIQRVALKAVYTLSIDDNNEVELGRLGALPAVTRNLQSDDPEVTRRALAAISNLSVNDSNKEEITRLGILPNIVKFLRSSDERIKRDAARIVRNMSFNDEGKIILGEAGVTDPLLVILSNCTRAGSDEATVRYAAVALSILSINTAVRGMIYDSGGIETLLKALATRDKDTKRAVVGCMINLSIARTHKEEIRRAGGVEPLLQCLGSHDGDTVRYALRALYNVSLNEEVQADIVRLNGIPGVMRLLSAAITGDPEREELRGTMNVDTTVYALNFLSNVAQRAEARSVIRKQRGLGILLSLLGDGEIKIQVHALKVLAIVTINEEARMELKRDADGLRRIIFFLQHNDADAVRFAASVVKNIAFEARYELQAIPGALSAISRLRRHGDKRVQDLGLAAVRSMCVDEELNMSFRKLR